MLTLPPKDCWKVSNSFTSITGISSLRIKSAVPPVEIFLYHIYEEA